MPEGPEVEAVTGVVRRHALGMHLDRVEVLRGKRYFGGPGSFTTDDPTIITDVYRVGKVVMLQISPVEFIQCRMGMSGYFDWDCEPWTFDYVEGKRTPRDNDVRVLLYFTSDYVNQGDTMTVTKTLRFHDARLFGELRFVNEHPKMGPEVLGTQWGFRLPMSLREFAGRVLRSPRPIKSLLMDQHVMASLGNIYAAEGLHVAGINPHTPGDRLDPHQVPLLLEALRSVCALSIPVVTYSWLNVYRRSLCGSCSGPVTRTLLDGRATFHCHRCQGDA